MLQAWVNETVFFAVTTDAHIAWSPNVVGEVPNNTTRLTGLFCDAHSQHSKLG